MKSSYKVLFSKLIVAKYSLTTFTAALRDLKPWTMDKAEKIEVDKAMVKAICTYRGYEVAEGGRKWSKLTIARPEVMNEAQERDYGACKTALSRCRDLFDKPKEHAAATHTDVRTKLVKQAAKTFTTTREQVALINALKREFGLS